MTKMVPNDKDESLEFLRKLYLFRKEINRENTKIKHRRLEKEHLHVKKMQDNGELPFIEIPEVMHTEEHGDLVFRIDRENGKIRIMKRIYQWDSDKDDIDDE